MTPRSRLQAAAQPPPPKSAPPSTREGEVRRASARSKPKTRSERFAEAHASVLAHHAETFRKLAE